MRGNITRRGKSSWRIKFDHGFDPTTGKRLTHFETVHGSKRDAVNLLVKRLAERGDGHLVRPTRDTVADYARHWLTNIAPAATANKTRERYAEHLSAHIIPRLGNIALQKLEATDLDAFYMRLRTKGRRDGKGGLAPATIAHVHKVLTQILKSAVKARRLRRSPMEDVQTKPKARQEEQHPRRQRTRDPSRALARPLALCACAAHRHDRIKAWRAFGSQVV
jgi:Phage integrase, N-terminal SAM-like domain